MADREQLARTIRTLADAIGPATLEGFAGAAWDLGCLAERAGTPIEETRARDVAELVGDYPELQPLTSDPWLPIEECGELEDGWYDVWVVKPEYDGGAGQLMHARRFPSGEFVVAGLIYEAQHITHVHRMGPVRGPREG